MVRDYTRMVWYILQHMVVMLIFAARCRCCVTDKYKSAFLYILDVLHICAYLYLHIFYLLCLLGWEVAGDHIQSGAGRSDNDYLILTLRVPGFK